MGSTGLGGVSSIWQGHLFFQKATYVRGVAGNGGHLFGWLKRKPKGTMPFFNGSAKLRNTHMAVCLGQRAYGQFLFGPFWGRPRCRYFGGISKRTPNIGKPSGDPLVAWIGGSEVEPLGEVMPAMRTNDAGNVPLSAGRGQVMLAMCATDAADVELFFENSAVFRRLGCFARPT